MTGPPGARAKPSRPPKIADEAKGTSVWNKWLRNENRTALMLNTNSCLVNMDDLSSFGNCVVFSQKGEERELENICILLGRLINRFY